MVTEKNYTAFFHSGSLCHVIRKRMVFGYFLKILEIELDLDAFNPNIELDEDRFDLEFSDSNRYVFFTVILRPLPP